MIEMAKMTLSGLQELSMLVANGFTFTLVKATDGTDIVLAKKGSHTRIFQLIVEEQED